MEDIHVKVVKFGDRKFLQMQYKDPITGRKQTKSSKTTNRREAERASAKLEAELREGRYKPAAKITWAEFRVRYEDEVLVSLAENTDRIVGTVFNSVERILDPLRLSDLNAERLSYYQSQLRSGVRDARAGKCIRKPVSESTIRSYLAHLRAAMRWATDIGLATQSPKIKMPKRVKGSRTMKGRPVTAEEFERMLCKVESALFDRSKKPGKKMRMSAPKLSDEVRTQVVDTWKRFLTGLWLSGLRLGEALDLWWDDDTKLTVDFSGRRPMFRILAELEKGNRDRYLPMAPDFATFLETLPANHEGPIFKLLGIRGRECRDLDWASRMVSRIGEAARVKVDTDPGSGKIKFASAHDLRRAFGNRWAKQIMPAVLKELMRHDDISTTMKYYAEQDAQSVADVVWESFESSASPPSNTFGNSVQENGTSADMPSTRKSHNSL